MDCCDRKRLLMVMTSTCACAAFGLLCIAVATDYWLYTKKKYEDINGTSTYSMFWSGLFRKCKVDGRLRYQATIVWFIFTCVISLLGLFKDRGTYPAITMSNNRVEATNGNDYKDSSWLDVGMLLSNALLLRSLIRQKYYDVDTVLTALYISLQVIVGPVLLRLGWQKYMYKQPYQAFPKLEPYLPSELQCVIVDLNVFIAVFWIEEEEKTI